MHYMDMYVYISEAATGSQSTMPASYQKQLIQRCNSTASKSNRRLTKAFGLTRESGIMFVHLSLAPKELKHVVNREEYVSRTAAKLESWESLSVETILDPITSVDGPYISPRNILVLGTAGIGKTTVTHRLAHSWDSQTNHQFQAIYRFECRNFRTCIGGYKEYSFADLIFSMHGPQERHEEVQLNILEALDDRRTLIIFDGLDELDTLKYFKRSNNIPVTDPTMKTTIPNLIANLHEGNLFPNARFMCTTRPNNNVDFSEYDRVVVVLGFNRNSINECMLEVCNQDTKQHQHIMHHINRTQLYTHCYVPLTCVILGLILSSEVGQSHMVSSMDRFTHLYIAFTHKLLRNIDEQIEAKGIRKIVFDKNTQDSLHRITNLAARGIMSEERVIIFDDEDLNDLEDEDHNVGMIEFFENSAGKCVASFIHFSYQEFLTAVWLSINWNSEDITKVKKKCKENTTFDMVLLYTAGLLGDRKTGQVFLKNVDPKLEKVDLTGRAVEMVDMVHTLAEEGDKQHSKRLRVLMLMCLSEGKLALMKENWKITDLDLSGTSGGLLPHQLVSISYYLEFDVVKALRFVFVTSTYVYCIIMSDCYTKLCYCKYKVSNMFSFTQLGK